MLNVMFNYIVKIQVNMNLVLDFPPDPLQCFLLCFGQGQLGWDGVALSNQGAFFLLGQEQGT